MPHYPHMLAEDVVVWTRFLQQNPETIREVWYDVHVGLPMPLPVGATDVQRRVAEGVSRKRIDVVARIEEGILVIEIKPYGNMVALGQAIVYTRLFEQEFEVDTDIYPAIVCAEADPDLKEEFKWQGIWVYEVGFS